MVKYPWELISTWSFQCMCDAVSPKNRLFIAIDTSSSISSFVCDLVRCVISNHVHTYVKHMKTLLGAFHSHGGTKKKWMVYIPENSMNMDDDTDATPSLGNPQYHSNRKPPHIMVNLPHFSDFFCDHDVPMADIYARCTISAPASPSRQTW